MGAATLGNPVVVLVLEDDPQTRELFRTVLRNDGYSVVAVGDGIAALTYLDTHIPNAVVLDLGLPRVHGRDVLNEMAAHGVTQPVPVVVVTGEETPGLNEADFACVLRKPIMRDQLIDAVRRCLKPVDRLVWTDRKEILPVTLVLAPGQARMVEHADDARIDGPFFVVTSSISPAKPRIPGHAVRVCARHVSRKHPIVGPRAAIGTGLGP